jgi:predicted dinucleotide-binding enzyme
MKKVAIVGSGVVGEALANGFLKHGHEVMRASRDPAKLDDWKSAAGRGAVKGTAAESAVDLCGVAALEGKVVIDATNPIADEPPENGVLRYFSDINSSLMETLQRKVAGARFVKAFSCVGSAFMVDPDFGASKPTMFICGDDAAAKAEVTGVLDRFGWEVEDMGGAEAARAIEPLAMLWCIPGLRENRWSHAFKLLKR